jgi:hypothetical protein
VVAFHLGFAFITISYCVVVWFNQCDSPLLNANPQYMLPILFSCSVFGTLTGYFIGRRNGKLEISVLISTVSFGAFLSLIVLFIVSVI